MIVKLSKFGAIVSAASIVATVSYLQAASVPVASRQAQTPDLSAQARPLSQREVLDRYCVTCHNERLKTAGLTLDKMDPERVVTDAQVWETVVRKLRAGVMPPAGARRPDKATHDSLISALEAGLDLAGSTSPPQGPPIVRRLNRVEYVNAIRDLLGLEISGPALLPADESSYGFDNIADVLSVTPGILDRYLLAAQKISRMAIPEPTMRAVKEKFTVSPLVVQHDRVSDDLPYMSRGGTVIRHSFPFDGEYVLSVRLRRAFQYGSVQGLERREELDVRLDGERLKLFAVGGECVESKEPRCLRAEGVEGTSEYERTADSELNVRFQAKAGMRLIGVSFAKRNVVQEGAAPERPPQGRTSGPRAEMSVDSVEIEGPFTVTGRAETPSREKIFLCRASDASSELPCANTILSRLARRAYRRPVTEQDSARLQGFYHEGRRQGKSFEAGVRFALERLLVSPSFLLRVEGLATKGNVREAARVADIDLASRLSFFLWSSIPDEELLEAAIHGQLSDPKILEQQVRRMLADPRASSLITNFASQWLLLRNIRQVKPDTQVFPDFDDSLRLAFERETELFLENQLREDHSVVDLLTADYTFLNERLARFYGVPNVYGTHFRRVQLTDPSRRGLLGHGSILTVTSPSTRTSPVMRGKWLLTNILGTPPAPPPPGVETDLKETSQEGEAPTSIRARMEEHRKNPMCATCHRQMDPMGFALENFTAIGKWRTTDGVTPVDATGSFPDGTSFSNPAEFVHALVGRRDQFVRTLVEKLLTYGLGRGVEYFDMPALRTIIREAEADEYRWSAIILGVVRSAPFQAPARREPNPGTASPAQ